MFSFDSNLSNSRQTINLIVDKLLPVMENLCQYLRSNFNFFCIGEKVFQVCCLIKLELVCTDQVLLYVFVALLHLAIHWITTISICIREKDF